jgi:hypothetical protein
MRKDDDELGLLLSFVACQWKTTKHDNKLGSLSFCSASTRNHKKTTTSLVPCHLLQHNKKQ